MPGVAGSFGFNSTCEMLFAGKSACFAPSPQDALWLIDTFQIDAVFASPQQALALAEIQEKKTRYPLTSVKTLSNTTGSGGLEARNRAELQAATFEPIVQKGKRIPFVYEYRVHY